MFFKIAIAFLAILIAGSKGCTDVIIKCLNPLREIEGTEVDLDEGCRRLDLSQKCFRDAAELCLSEEGKAEMINITQQIENNLEQYCSDEENKTSVVAGSKTEQERCAYEILECLDPLQEAVASEAHLNETCRVIELSHKCVKDKAELCLSKEEQAEIQSDLQPVANLLKQNCSFEENKIPSDSG